MNRLWVRLSLAFAAVVIVAVLAIGLTIRMTNAVMIDPPSGSARPLPNLTTVMAVIGVVAIGAGTWMSRSLTAPLAELEALAQAVGGQDFDQRVPVRGGQELVAVSTAFNEMAERLGQAEMLRRNMLADVAHELRHPVHVLQGSIQAFLDDVYPLNKEEIARLCDQTHHLTVLVNDLHVLAQAEAHQLPLRKQMTDIGAFVKETVTALRPLANAKDITMQVELLGTMPKLTVDTARLRQAIHNLVDNGLHYTPEGGDITASVEQVQDETQVRVRDTGAGIPPEKLPHVFDRFYPVNDARSRDKGGTGLGLAITKAIVEAHGGTLTVTSQVGEGSTFTIALPNTLPKQPRFHRRDAAWG